MYCCCHYYYYHYYYYYYHYHHYYYYYYYYYYIIGWRMQLSPVRLPGDSNSNWLDLHASGSTDTLSRGTSGHVGNKIYYGFIYWPMNRSYSRQDTERKSKSSWLQILDFSASLANLLSFASVFANGSEIDFACLKKKMCGLKRYLVVKRLQFTPKSPKVLFQFKNGQYSTAG